MALNRLKELRLLNGKTQMQVASWLSITQAAYSKYECDRAEPSIEALSILSMKYNVSVDYLLGRENEKTPPAAELTEDEQKLIALISELTDEETQELSNFVDYILSKRKQ